MAPPIENKTGGFLRDVNKSSNQVYTRPPAKVELIAPKPAPRPDFELAGKHGTFTVNVQAAGRGDPPFMITYQPDTKRSKLIAKKYTVERAALLRFVRTGHGDELDRDVPKLHAQSHLRTDPYSAYRVDRIIYRTPFAGQQDPTGNDNTFRLQDGNYIDVKSKQHYALERDSPQLLKRMLDEKSLFFRFEAISAVVDYVTGEIFEAVEWGAHVERKNLQDFGTCTVYAPSLLYENMKSKDSKIRTAATERELGMKLAMARWNNDYAMLVEKLYDVPRFKFLSTKFPNLGSIGEWHKKGRFIQKIPGEQSQWKYEKGMRIDIAPPAGAASRS